MSRGNILRGNRIKKRLVSLDGMEVRLEYRLISNSRDVKSSLGILSYEVDPKNSGSEGEIPYVFFHNSPDGSTSVRVPMRHVQTVALGESPVIKMSDSYNYEDKQWRR